MTRDEALALGRKQGASAGGQAVKTKTPPESCLRCGQPMAERKWHSYLGHLGLHGLADRYFGGDMGKAQQRLQNNGLAGQDPAPWNGAWSKYQPVTTGGLQGVKEIVPVKTTELNNKEITHEL